MPSREITLLNGTDSLLWSLEKTKKAGWFPIWISFIKEINDILWLGMIPGQTVSESVIRKDLLEKKTFEMRPETWKSSRLRTTCKYIFESLLAWASSGALVRHQIWGRGMRWAYSDDGTKHCFVGKERRIILSIFTAFTSVFKFSFSTGYCTSSCSYSKVFSFQLIN